MTHPSLSDPYFVLLLVWRGVISLFALHAVIEKPFDAMLMSLAVLGALVYIGELAYKGRLYLEQERQRKQLDQALRERRAEEARLRLEAAKAQSERKGFGLDDDIATEPAVVKPAVEPGRAMSAADFDLALMAPGRTQDTRHS